MIKRFILSFLIFISVSLFAQLNTESEFLLGHQKYKQKNYTEAIFHFNVLINRNEDQYRVLYFRGLCKFALGDFVGAEYDLKKSIYYKPFQPDAYHNLALVLLNSGKVFSGIQNLNTSIEQDSSNAQAFYHRAISKFQIHQFSSAKSDIEKCLKLNKLTYKSIRLRSEINKAEENYELALKDINVLIAKKIDKEQDLLLRAELLQKQEFFEKALEDANQVLSMNFNNIDAQYIKAYSFHKLNKSSQCIDLLNSILLANPGHTRSLYLLAVEQWKKKEFEKAEVNFTQLLEIMPKNILIITDLARLNIQLHKYSKAIYYLDKAKVILPNYPETYQIASQLYSNRKQYSKAKTENENYLFYSEKVKQYSPEQNYIWKEKYLTMKSVEADDYKIQNAIKEELRLSTRVELALKLIDEEESGMYFKSKSELIKTSENILPLKRIFKVLSDYQNRLYTTKIDSMINILGKNIKNERDYEYLKLEHLVIQKKYDQAFDKAKLLFEKNKNNGKLNFILAGLYWDKWEKLDQSSKSDSWMKQSNSKEEDALNELELKIDFHFMKAIKFQNFPDFVYYNYALYKAQLGEGKRAISLLEQAFLINPDEKEIAYNLGLINYKLDHFEEACKYLSIAGSLGKKEAYELIPIICN